ncbi:TNF receptor-associated factor family protein [Senna tora]|uniref:TNF receptor-associated factor family protein n=1 Tax=Senna tora TaxID=362788 RepID=A0A834W390_9FABA|nr:TNF receptor-associated factor family protein [Senna tora]
MAVTTAAAVVVESLGDDGSGRVEGKMVVMVLSSMDLPTIDVNLEPEKIENEEERNSFFHCDLFDTEIVHKLAQMLLPGLATACVDNTSGDLFKTPGSVAVNLRNEMIDYLTHRSQSFVAESVVLEGDLEGEVSDHPFDIISYFVDDFASSKRNMFSRFSGWLLSDLREDKIDDFVQEMEMNRFWLLDRRETLAETLVKNVDFKNLSHCSMKFNSAQELANHVDHCSFRSMICQNQGCDARFCASHLEKHDSTCPFKMIPCEQNCSDSIMRREMDRHCITSCPMKLVNCPFYGMGCRSAIAQCMIDKHCTDNLHSHLLYILQGTYRKASEEDLKRRVEQILQASSNNQLAEAQGVRSLRLIVKDIDSKLGRLEVSTKKNKSAENMAKNIKINGSKQNQQTSNPVNSSDKVEVNAIMNKNSAENYVENKDGECSCTKSNGSDESIHTSDMAILSVEAEVSSVNKEKDAEATENSAISKDRAGNKIKNKDAGDVNLRIKDEEITETNTASLSGKVEVSAASKDNAEHYIKNKNIDNNNLKGKDNEETIHTSKMENLEGGYRLTCCCQIKVDLSLKSFFFYFVSN